MKTWLWLWFSLLVAGIAWLYMHRIFTPWSSYVRAQETPIVAEMGDLYSPWVGARELILHGRNPYSSEVSHEIQMAFYGHPIYQTYGKVGTVLNEQRFAYPVYAVFLMAPTVRADFSRLRRWSVIGLVLLTVLSVLLWLDFLHWRPPLTASVAISIFVLSCPQIVQGLRLQQLGLLVGFLLALSAWCILKNRLATAGVLLAFATIKPQMSLLPLCFFLLWVIGEWRKRWRLLAALSLTLSILIGAGELLLPGWIGYFLTAAVAYSKYSPAFTSLPRVVLGDTGAEILGAVIMLGLLLGGWQSRKEEADSGRFAAVFSAFLIGTTLIFPLLTPFNQVLLILPTMLLLYNWSALPRLSRVVFIVIAAWPAITSAALLLRPPMVHSLSQLPLLPSFLTLSYPVFLPLLLMTRRSHIAPRLDSAKISAT